MENSGINFGQNSYNASTLTPEMQKKLQAQENFQALNKEQLQKDAFEITNAVKENAKENFIFKTLKKMGVKDPKKTIKSIGLTIGTVVGLAVLGNKSVSKMTKLGISFSEWETKTGAFQKLQAGKATAGKFLNNHVFKSAEQGGNALQKFAYTIKDTIVNKCVQPVWNFARGYGHGFISIFSLTPPDTLQNAFKGKNASEIEKSLKKLVKDDKAKEFADLLCDATPSSIRNNKEFCLKFSEAIRENFNCKSNKEFNAILEGLKKGEINGIDCSEFCNINMVDKSVLGVQNSWWPVNIVNSIGKKIRGDKWKGFCRGNVGDSLIKFNVVNGTLADTKMGSLIQQSILVPTESISNFVNDKSGLGFFLSLGYLGTFNNMQDAPKEQKIGTIADDFITTIGSIAIATPIASKLTYGLASLSKVGLKVGQNGEILKDAAGKVIVNEGYKGLGYKLTRGIGRIFGTGLNYGKGYKPEELIHPIKAILGLFSGNNIKYSTSFGKRLANTLKSYSGGVGRFALLLLVFAPIFSKPIKKVVNKIFGKPYDPQEVEREKQRQEQENAIIPELGISAKELNEKIKAHPEVIQQIQTNPQLAQHLKENPKGIVDLLDGKNPAEIMNKTTSSATPQTNFQQKRTLISPMNKQHAQNKGVTNSQQQTTVSNNQNKTSQAENKSENKPDASQDTATYIPSSQFKAKNSSIGTEVYNQYQKLMTDADKCYERAIKMTNI